MATDIMQIKYIYFFNMETVGYCCEMESSTEFAN